MTTHPVWQYPSVWKRIAIAMTTSTLLLGGPTMPLMASTIQSPFILSQRQTVWDSELRVARLIKNEQQETDLVIQVDLLDKPETTYANAVYQVFARQSGQWQEIYTNVGARLIQNSAGRTTLPPEIISMSDLQEQLQDRFDDNRLTIAEVELKTIVHVRYDANGRRDQQVEFEQVQFYDDIAQTTQSQLFAQRQPNSQFNLVVLQADESQQEVIARVSLKAKQEDRFQAEQWIGDYRYQNNQGIQFTEGLAAGDRVVVRLFDADYRFIGYSEFDCLEGHSVVHLVTADRVDEGIVRTVYGQDRDIDGYIDADVETYDYFSQVTTVSNTQYSSSTVTFLETTQSISNINAFSGWGLPTPSQRCRYPIAIERGSHALVNRRLRAFYSGLSSSITTVPEQAVDLFSVSSSRTTIDVSQVIDVDVNIDRPGGWIINSCDLYCVEQDDEDEIEGCDEQCPGNDNGDHQQTITLTNGYRVTFLGVAYQRNTSIWRYYVEELPRAQDLSNWVLGLPSCANVADASPRGELVNPDPNARISGIKWQPGGGFVEGEFSITLSGQLSIGQIDVAVKGPDVAWGTIAGPSCGS